MIDLRQLKNCSLMEKGILYNQVIILQQQKITYIEKVNTDAPLMAVAMEHWVEWTNSIPNLFK